MPDETLTVEEAVEAAIDACGGDLRATIRALIIANAFLEEELERKTSAGYTRRRRPTGNASA